MDFLPVVRAATPPVPLQWNQGSDIAGCPSPRCPWAPALPAGPPADAAPEGHPRKVMWATGSQTARWSNLWPWSLGRREGWVRCGMTQRNDLYFPWIIKWSCEITIANWAGRQFKTKFVGFSQSKKEGFTVKAKCGADMWVWREQDDYQPKAVNFSFHVTVCLLLFIRTWYHTASSH